VFQQFKLYSAVRQSSAITHLAAFKMHFGRLRELISRHRVVPEMIIRKMRPCEELCEDSLTANLLAEV
jgi:hypothetical protein